MNFVESFSETIPHPVPDGEQRTWKIPGVHSHFAVNDPKVIAALTDVVARFQPGSAPVATDLQLVERAA